MRSKILLILALAAPVFSGFGQANDPSGHRNFPLILSVQFHALSLPFKHITSNFRNIGFGVGTEVSLNGHDNWVQQFQFVWFHNKTVGNGLLFYTQTAWRPGFGDTGFAEVKAGLGYLHEFRPVEAFKQVNGKWISDGHRGKGMLTIPVGVSLGYRQYATSTYVAPFVTYQFMILNNYSQSIPIVPQTLLQVGARIHSN